MRRSTESVTEAIHRVDHRGKARRLRDRHLREPPSLRRFPVAQTGPVLLYLAEDAPAVVRARLEGLCQSRGVGSSRNQSTWSRRPLLGASTSSATGSARAPRSTSIDLQRDSRRLNVAVDRHRLVPILLDPFVRTHRVDENDAGQVATILDELRQLQRRHELAICVVHHARKNRTSASTGRADRGTFDDQLIPRGCAARDGSQRGTH
jgi:RecA-family ATPase